MSIAHLIDQHVKRAPFKKALFYPSGIDALGNDAYAHLTYQQLKDRADRVADGLRNKGVKKGTKVLLFVRPSLEFPVLAYALFKIGAVAILIDPGITFGQTAPASHYVNIKYVNDNEIVIDFLFRSVHVITLEDLNQLVIRKNPDLVAQMGIK